MEELTRTQLFMIEQIEKEILKVREKIQKATYEEKPRYRIRLTQLEKQLENAKKPINRTEKEKELINKVINNIENNVEIEEPIKIEGDRSDKKLTSKEELKYKLLRYINDNKNKIVELQKVIAVQEEIYSVLLNHEPASEEMLYKQNIGDIYNNIIKLKVAVRTMQDRVEKGDEIINKIEENYKFISEINRFLGNVMTLKDYEEYTENLKQEVEGD